MEIKLIESTANPLIKDLKKLKDKKFRKTANAFLIEGERFVKEALKLKADIRTVLFTDEMEGKTVALFQDLPISNTIAFIKITGAVLKELTDTVNPQGLVCEVHLPEQGDVLRPDGRYLFLDKLQDPGNLGTIIRSAHAFAYDGILLGKGCVDPYSDKVLRSTMGSIFQLVLLDSSPEHLDSLQREGYRILLSEPAGEQPLKAVDFSPPFIAVIGNEANGVGEAVLNVPHTSFQIPMPGASESLNAAVAASIIMYESRR